MEEIDEENTSEYDSEYEESESAVANQNTCEQRFAQKAISKISLIR